MDGLLLVDKPGGPTSHDVVARIRRILGRPKAGHFGTLDPLASGLLVLAVGRAVRFNRFYAGRDKSYRAVVRLGRATDTYDAEGAPLQSPSGPLPDRTAVEAALAAFRGAIEQVPPPFSAKKVDGRRLYESARAGRPVAAAACRVTVHEIRILGFTPPDLEIDVRCSTGTYLRSLAHDLGRALGCGAHLAALRRTAVGEMRVEAALPPERWDALAVEPPPAAAWIPLERLLPEWPSARLDEEGARLVRNGRALPPERIAAWRDGESSPAAPAGEPGVRVFEPSGRLAALARREPGGSLAPFLVFPGD